jgi:hypothetical protein
MIQNHNNLAFRATHHRRCCRPPNTRPSSQHRHNMLGTIIDKLTTIVTALQSIATEQQELIYKIEAMTAATYEMPALHPNLPWVIDE